MKPTDASYIAALIDTIGSIKIEPPKKSEISCLYVRVIRSDFKLMEYLQRAGAYIIDLGEGRFEAKWKDHKAYYLLKSIIIFSQLKKEQMAVGIEFFEVKTKEPKEEKFDIPFRLRLKLLRQAEK